MMAQIRFQHFVGVKQLQEFSIQRAFRCLKSQREAWSVSQGEVGKCQHQYLDWFQLRARFQSARSAKTAALWIQVKCWLGGPQSREAECGVRSQMPVLT